MFAELGRRARAGAARLEPSRGRPRAGRGDAARRRRRPRPHARRATARCSSSTLDGLDALLVLRDGRRASHRPRSARRRAGRRRRSTRSRRSRTCASCRRASASRGPEQAAQLRLEGALLTRGAAARHRRDDGTSSPSTTRRSASSSTAPIGVVPGDQALRSPTCYVRQEMARAAVYAAGATLDDPRSATSARAVASARSRSRARPR